MNIKKNRSSHCNCTHLNNHNIGHSNFGITNRKSKRTRRRHNISSQSWRLQRLQLHTTLNHNSLRHGNTWHTSHTNPLHQKHRQHRRKPNYGRKQLEPIKRKHIPNNNMVTHILHISRGSIHLSNLDLTASSSAGILSTFNVNVEFIGTQ